jgi:exoribonuclease-2
LTIVDKPPLRANYSTERGNFFMKENGSTPADLRTQPQRPPQGNSNDRSRLAGIARQAMIARGLEPDFTLAARQELATIAGPAAAPADVRDLRDRLWASIDNDDSRDLDQLTVAESLAGGRVRILVAIADVDALVRKGSEIDGHASRNTTSVYTPAAIFPMLPETLSTDLTSLNEDQDRLAVVTDMVFEADGSLASSEVYRARVRNRAKLAYRSVAAWLIGTGPAPRRVVETPGLDEISAFRIVLPSSSWSYGTGMARSALRRLRRTRSSTATRFPISIWIGRTEQNS